MAMDALRELVTRLNTSATALAALGAALDARTSRTSLDSAIAPHVDEILAALGVETLDGLTQAELRSTLGEIRSFTLTNAKLLFGASRGSRWEHTEPEILEAAGEVSAAFPRVLERAIVPKLEGLADRLISPGAAFLDVGVGVAAMSIEMVRVWPSLRVVGIDPWAPALAIGRERVRAAGLDARIELRELAAEKLADEDAFDLAWIPSVFVPERAIRTIVQRVHRALRPGGWLLFPMMRPGSDRLAASLVRLRTAMFGGCGIMPENVERLLCEAGFVDVRMLPSDAASLTAMVVGRRLGGEAG
jgi:SAM-dependent methyltransferase